jgi:hypothetical protein
MGILRTIAVRLSQMQDQKLLTLSWRLFCDMVTILWQAALTSKSAYSSIVEQVYRAVRRFSKMQGLKSFKRQWHPFVEHCEDVVESIFAQKGGR